MIVTCERCDTKFQLDDARVPATGARVRCSKCKHAFLALPADASGEGTVHAFALDAAIRGVPTPVSVAEDPPEDADPAEVDESGKAAESEEHDWQFAEQERTAPARASRREKAAPDQWDDVLTEEKPPEAMDLDALGSPESWSFVSENGPAMRSVRSTGAPAPATARPVPIGRIRLVAASRALDASTSDASAAPAPARRMLERVGWALTGLLLLAIGYGIDWNGPTSSTLPRSFALPGGLVVEDLTLVRLENLAAGHVLVVAGVLTNPGSLEVATPSRLRAQLVWAGSTASGEATPLRASEALRERPPEEAILGAGLLAAPLASGARVPFEAVIEHPPRGDARLELLLEPAEEGAVTGDPSPPTPLPSSG